jgi:crossover junction endodeoxyribonuclease RuvC
MIVLGIDQSYTRTGYAVLETDGVPGRERVLETGTLTTDRARTDTQRQRDLAASLVQIVDRVGPDLVGVERPYVSREQSPDVALRLSGLQAAVMGALDALGIHVVAVHTATRQSALGVPTRQQRTQVKRQILAAVRLRYGLDVSEDEADAIGIALGAVLTKRRQSHSGAQLKLGLGPGRA